MTGRRTDEPSEAGAESHGRAGDAEPFGEDDLSLPVVACAPTEPFRVRSVNTAFEAAFDTAADVGGLPVADLLASALGATVDDVDAAVRAAAAGDRPVLDPARAVRADDAAERGGAAGGYLLTYHPADDGATARFLLEDVTEQQRRIRELEAERDRLVTLVHSFVHDVRNPLEVAAIRLDAARETDEYAHLTEVERAHDRIERLSDEMRVLADDGAVDGARFVDTDVAQVARDAWRLVESGDATLELDDDLPTVRAAPSRLQRLFENLFRNSVEHGSTSSRSKTGDRVEHGSTRGRPGADDAVAHGSANGDAPAEPALHVSVRSVDGGFAVEDDGRGIPPARRDRVFERGFTTNEEGTGLGLAIVRRVANGHGWEVTAGESERGGTRIRVDVRRGGGDGCRREPSVQ